MGTRQLKVEAEISFITCAVAAFVKCEQSSGAMPSSYEPQGFLEGLSRTACIKNDLFLKE